MPFKCLAISDKPSEITYEACKAQLMEMNATIRVDEKGFYLEADHGSFWSTGTPYDPKKWRKRVHIELEEEKEKTLLRVNILEIGWLGQREDANFHQGLFSFFIEFRSRLRGKGVTLREIEESETATSMEVSSSCPHCEGSIDKATYEFCPHCGRQQGAPIKNSL